MKSFKMVWIICCLNILFTPICAQNVDDSIRFVHSIWRAEQRRAILSHMQFSDSEKSAFWSVYDSYCSAIEHLELEYILIVYLNEKNLNERMSRILNTELLKNDYTMAKVRRLYYKKFSQAVSPLKAGEFIQMDNSLRVLFHQELQKGTPLIEISQAAVYSFKMQHLDR